MKGDRWDVERNVTGSNLPPLSRLIMLALLSKVDNTTARTTPEHTPAFSTLCAMTGLSKAVVSEWLQALEAGGWVTRINPNSGGKGNRTLYQLQQGADTIERRSRDLRTPRPKKVKPAAEVSSGAAGTAVNSSPSERLEDAQTVRPANALEAKQFAQRTPNGSPGELFEPSKGSPGERATTLRTTKNHHGAQGAKNSPTPAGPWTDANRKPTTPAPKPRASDALFPKPKRVNVDRLAEAHQVIYWWLQNTGYRNFDADDIRQVHSALIVAHGTKLNPGYLRAVVNNGGAIPHAEKIRQARNKKVADAVSELQAAMPQCIHGTPAGNLPHPTTGDLLCAQCRRGLPATDQPDATNLVVRATLDAYRRARGNDILINELLTVTQQIEAFVAEGATPEELIPLAQKAGAQRVSLITAAGVAA